MTSPLAEKALFWANSQVGARETTRNSGPMVDEYLKAVGLEPGRPWCAAFVAWCFVNAARELNVANPCPVTAGALRLFDISPVMVRMGAFNTNPQPGDVFVIDHGHGLGHVGFVRDTDVLDDGETLYTTEGNTDPNGSREGDGVYQRTRARSEINYGFLRF